jgi:hypothetical protein
VLLTHGYTDALCRHLRETGLDAAALRTEYGAEDQDMVRETGRETGS